jgi:hypothetical protein
METKSNAGLSGAGGKKLGVMLMGMNCVLQDGKGTEIHCIFPNTTELYP